MKSKKLFYQAAAAGIAFLLAGCGLEETYKELKNELEAELASKLESELLPNLPEKKKTQSAAESTEAAEPSRQKASEVLPESEEAVLPDTEAAEPENMENTQEPDHYAYAVLDQEQKTVYREILSAILQHQESIKVSTLNVDVLEASYQAVSADYGGLFWVSGYVYTQYTRGGEPSGMEFAPKYIMEYEKRKEIQAQIDASAAEFLSGISASHSDYEKAKYVFEVLVENVDYETNAQNNQNIISVFLNRKTVCQGYACATQYLLNLLGIQSAVVTGSANGESHAWNLVRLDGKYYYMDTTWGNSRYLDHSSQMEKYVNYNYLAITSEELSRTHTLDNSFPLPECTSMEDNYFVKENRYFSEWTPDAIGSVLAEAWNAKRSDAAVKFSSPELYEYALDYFVTQQHIADYCENISSIYYLEDKELYVMTFRFSNSSLLSAADRMLLFTA